MNAALIGQVVAGLALLLFGLRLASVGPRDVLGRRLRVFLETVTRNRWSGLGAGIGTTLLLSSSSAATVLVVGLVDAGLIGLGRIVAVLLGTGIGTALTLQIVAFRIGAYAGFAIGLGLVLRLVSRYRIWRAVGDAIMGLGLIFFSLDLMGDGLAGLVSGEAASQAVAALLGRPVVTLLTAAALTAVWQSSAATILLAFPILASPGVTLTQVVPIVLGANIGTCATALLACVGGGRRGLQVAMAHLLFKVVGVAVALPLAGVLAAAAAWVADLVGAATPARQVAMAHTLFNAAIAALFLPFPELVAGLLGRLIPADRRGKGVVENVHPDLWADPEQALTAAHGEVLGMGHRALWCLAELGRLLERPHSRLADDIVRADDRIDVIDEVLTHYLTEDPPADLTADQREFRDKLLFAIKDIEHVGDVISKVLVPLAVKLERRERGFSEAGLAELKAFHARVTADFAAALDLLAGKDAPRLDDIFAFEATIQDRDHALEQAHLQRLERGVQAAVLTSTIHLDLLTNLRVVHSYVTDLVRVITWSPGGPRRGDGPFGAPPPKEELRP